MVLRRRRSDTTEPLRVDPNFERCIVDPIDWIRVQSARGFVLSGQLSEAHGKERLARMAWHDIHIHWTSKLKAVAPQKLNNYVLHFEDLISARFVQAAKRSKLFSHTLMAESTISLFVRILEKPNRIEHGTHPVLNATRKSAPSTLH